MIDVLSESSVVRDLADFICTRITKSTIRKLQSMDTTLSGDDSELENPWDEICVQVQYEESFYWAAYEETARTLVDAAVDDLRPFEVAAVWLQTQEGGDWLWHEDDDREPYPVVTDNVVDYILSDYLFAEAGRWSNNRIRAHLDGASRRD